MKRFQFIKNIAAGLGLVAVAPQILEAAPLRNVAQNRVRKPKKPQHIQQTNETAIMIYDEYVAGFRYYKGPKNIDALQVDDEIKLVREPNNKHDEFAVALHWGDKKIGYIRMDDNIVIANLIDNEVGLFTKISEIKKDAETWEQVAISVYLLFPCK